MIVCASRRTDICAFHSEWFMNRLDAGYVLVRNPVRRELVTSVSLEPPDVDHLVFITKDPSPMVPYLDRISTSFSTSFQITITPYGRDVEPNVPDVDSVIKGFKEVSEIVGHGRTSWRFDPILFTEGLYGQESVLSAFDRMCQSLSGYTERCIFSFLDYYQKLDGNLGHLGIYDCTDRTEFVVEMARIAKRHGICLSSCCEMDPGPTSPISRMACLDPRVLRGWNVPYEMPHAPVRPGCGCVKVIDIGEYDTCFHDCRYCYANSPSTEGRRNRTFDPDSEFLCGGQEEGDIVKRPSGSTQTRLF